MKNISKCNCVNYNKAVIFFSGELNGNTKFYIKYLQNSDIYVADGGINLLEKINELEKTSYFPKEIWGDMDSISQKKLFELSGNYIAKDENSKTYPKIVRFSSDKNYTDGELILEYVLKKKYETIYIVGALGGRIDHTLTNINLLFKYSNTIILSENEILFSVKSGDNIFDKLNDLGLLSKKRSKNYIVSFIPYSDEIKDLSLIGYKYEVNNINLKRSDSRCMSNIFQNRNDITQNKKGEIYFDSGQLICVVNI